MQTTELLTQALRQGSQVFIELRYHQKRTRSIRVERGRVDAAESSAHGGVGVRVLEAGSFGFASTPELSLEAVEQAIERATRAARRSGAARRDKLKELPATTLARGNYEAAGVAEANARPFEALLELVLAHETMVRKTSTLIESAVCSYAETIEEKAIVTSDGACVSTRLVRPEFRIMAVAREAGELQRGTSAVGVTGGWDCLFRNASAEVLSERAARIAVDRLRAGYPEGGRSTVLLAPALVGLLTHEAVGHTVEADLVEAGSVANGKLGLRVASEYVTLCDSGRSEFVDGAGGTVVVDDEGVPAGRTVIIEQGLLKSYLHNRESAARAGVAPTGNGRAYEYQDEPLIRMRNTYIEPGTSSLEELIAGVADGYLLDGAANGQADSNGEFMFGTQLARRITRGVLGPPLRGVNLSGKAFEVLQSVDGVGSEFAWDLGSGHCGKGQMMKVDAGGPWLRCQALLGGRP